MNYTTGVLYELSTSTKLAQSRGVAFRFSGAVSISDIVGSEKEPAGLTDMTSIVSSEYLPFSEEAWESFAMLPRYISFIGSVGSIEMSRGSLDDRGAIS